MVAIVELLLSAGIPPAAQTTAVKLHYILHVEISQGNQHRCLSLSSIRKLERALMLRIIMAFDQST
jgi:hypothetical protein